MTLEELIKYERKIEYDTTNTKELRDYHKEIADFLSELFSLRERHKTKNILFVEDGSVDMDDLEDLKDMGVKIIVYRQGARIPEIWKFNNDNSDVIAIEFDTKTGKL